MLEQLDRKLFTIAWITDLALTWLALCLADVLRRAIALGKPIAPGQVYLTGEIYIVVTLLWTFGLILAGGYSLKKLEHWRGEAKIVFYTVSGSSLVFACFLYFFRYDDFSRLLFLYFYFLDLLFLLSWRGLALMLWKYIRNNSRAARKILIVGTGLAGQEVARKLQRYGWAGLKVAGFIRAGLEEEALPDDNFPPVLGNLEDSERIIKEHEANEVIIALPSNQREMVTRIALHLCQLLVTVKLMPDILDMVTVRATVEELDGIPLIGLSGPILDDFDRVVKRAFDLLLASLGLFLLSPLMALVALMIKLDSKGPVLFVQERAGENGKPFKMYKFRTMVANAEECLGELVDLEALEQPAFKLKDDPRVTRVGRILRRASLDELPQLFNVLKGEMSLVGPRPEEVKIVEMYDHWQRMRLMMKPGMTGPMQIHGRGDLPLNERVRLELDYIRNYSLIQDLKILLKTLPAIVAGNGAY